MVKWLMLISGGQIVLLDWFCSGTGTGATNVRWEWRDDGISSLNFERKSKGQVGMWGVGTWTAHSLLEIYIPGCGAAGASLSLSGSDWVRLICRRDSEASWLRLMCDRLMSAPVREYVSEFRRHRETVRCRIARCLAAVCD